MSRPPLTDAQLTAALQRVVPGEAPAGLHGRILAGATSTRQRRSLPSPLAVLFDVDPGARRRALLLVAALLVSLLLVGTAVVGSALIDRSRNPLLDQSRVTDPTPGPRQDLALAPPADVPAFVSSAYGRMPDLPPMTISAVDGNTTIRIYVDASGAVRIERGTAGSATPDTYEILAGTQMGTLVSSQGAPAWYQQDGAISEDPRVFVFAALGQAGVTIADSQRCEVAPSVQEQPSGEPGFWTYVGAELVAGRQAYHFACGERHLWIDVETRITLRSSGPLVGADWSVIPGETHTIEVTSIEPGQPPEALFAIRAPAGVPVLDDAQYACVSDPFCMASPRPIATPPPANPGGDQPPLKALIAAARRANLKPPPLQATIDGTNTKYPGSRARVFVDGQGRYRLESTNNLGRGDESTSVTLGGIERPMRSERQADGTTVWSDAARAPSTPWPLELPDSCESGWSHVGVDLILHRPADHVRCASDTSNPDYWIDRQTHLVVRTQGVTDAQEGTWVSEVTELIFGPQPEDLFDLPPGAVVRP